jgi:hypothetical protein
MAAPALRVLAAAPAIVLLGLVPNHARGFDPAPFLEEYEKLKRYIAETHANLEWILEHRDLDLRDLDRETTAALKSVRSKRQAREAIQQFIRSFEDPHFRADRREPITAGRPRSSARSARAAAITARTPAKKICRQIGFEKRDLDFRFRFGRLAGFTRLRSGRRNPFPAGVLELKGGRRLGLLRIAHFGEDGYPDACRETWDRFRSHVDGICDGGCEMAFRMEIRNGLLERIEERVEALEAAGIDALVVDITGNGGGTDWVQGAARILSPEKLECSRASFIKHPHWVGILESKREAIASELARDDLAAGAWELLHAADGRLASLLEEVRSECDRDVVWEGPDVSPGCSLLISGDYFTCGLFDYVARARVEGVRNPGVFFKPFQNRYRESVNTKPLYVLMDGRTASASEQFASILQGNGAATLIGQRTYGAGCGYTNGGVPLLLENAGLRVMAPDCVRYRVDGVNEIEGIDPEIEVPWSRGDSRKRRTEKLLEALDRLPR